MRVLVVEDDYKIAQAVKRALELKSLAVDVSHDSDEGLAFALDEPYDLIILDYMLPGSIDGIRLCQIVREKGKHTPVLMLTAKGNVEDRVAGLEAGADDYLVKPFALEELFARVHSLLRRPPQLLPNTLQSHDLTLNTVTLTVERGDRKIKVTQKECALLIYLLRHKGQILSKENIIAHVWDYDADILPNAVEACIRRLRAKIDGAFPDKPTLITTVYGFGYKVEA